MKRIPPQTFKTGKQTSPRRCRNGAFPGLDTQSREPVRRIRFDTGDSASKNVAVGHKNISGTGERRINHPPRVALFHSLSSSRVERGFQHVCGPISFNVCDRDAQRGALHIDHSIIYLSSASGLPATSLPRKGGSHEAAGACKPLKTWSGRRGSNPRVQLGNMSVDCK